MEQKEWFFLETDSLTNGERIGQHRSKLGPDWIEINIPLISKNGAESRGKAAVQAQLYRKGEETVESESGCEEDSIHRIGRFFERMYSTLFGLNCASYDHTETLSLKDGLEIRTLTPDIFYHDVLNGPRYIEVKSASQRNARPWCSSSQTENYLWALANRKAENPNTAPSLDFAFFGYGDGNCLNLDALDEMSTFEKLAESPNRLVVLPVNLFFLTLIMTPIEKRIIYASPGSCKESQEEGRRIRGGLLRYLHETREFDCQRMVDYYFECLKNGAKKTGKAHLVTPLLEDKMEATRKIIESDMLCLNDLTFGQRYSSDIRKMHFNNVPVRDFGIALYKVKDEKKLAENLAKYHAEIAEALGIRDLYAEWEKDRIPF